MGIKQDRGINETTTIELKPVMWRVLIEQWQAATTFGFFFALYQWALEWPASWVLLLLFGRASIHSFISRHKLFLRLSCDEVSGPKWTKKSRVVLSLSAPLTKSTFLWITTLKDDRGNEISFRKAWYEPKQFLKFSKTLERHHLQ